MRGEGSKIEEFEKNKFSGLIRSFGCLRLLGCGTLCVPQQVPTSSPDAHKGNRHGQTSSNS